MRVYVCMCSIHYKLCINPTATAVARRHSAGWSAIDRSRMNLSPFPARLLSFVSFRRLASSVSRSCRDRWLRLLMRCLQQQIIAARILCSRGRQFFRSLARHRRYHFAGVRLVLHFGVLMTNVAALAGICMMMVQPRVTVTAYPHGIIELFARQRGGILGAIGTENLTTASIIYVIIRQTLFFLICHFLSVILSLAINLASTNAYLQWCLRLPSQNSVLHPMQRVTAWSGTQRVGAGPNSSMASQDMSDGSDSPCSPALPTESGNEPYKSWIVWILLYYAVRVYVWKRDYVEILTISSIRSVSALWLQTCFISANLVVCNSFLRASSLS